MGSSSRKKINEVVAGESEASTVGVGGVRSASRDSTCTTGEESTGVFFFRSALSRRYSTSILRISQAKDGVISTSFYSTKGTLAL